MLTASRLREVLQYKPETGDFIHRRSKRTAGTTLARGYRMINIDGRGYYSHRLAWLWIHGEWPEQIDHINNNRSDNRLSNLRLATHHQNAANKSPRKGRPPKGVRQVSSGRWQAKITINRSGIYLGTFDTAEDAHAAYQAKARQAWGEFAKW